MATKRDLLRLLIQDIRKDVTDYQKLTNLLSQQRKLMLAHDVVSLIEHNNQQNELVSELQQRASKRSNILKKIGVTPDSKGIRKIITLLPAQHGEQVEQWWAKLQELVYESHALNEQNGQLLVRQQEMIKSVLNRDDDSTLVYSSNKN